MSESRSQRILYSTHFKESLGIIGLISKIISTKYELTELLSLLYNDPISNIVSIKQTSVCYLVLNDILLHQFNNISLNLEVGYNFIFLKYLFSSILRLQLCKTLKADQPSSQFTLF